MTNRLFVAFFLLFSSITYAQTPEYLQLQSGKKVVVLGINETILQKSGESAVVLKYQTDISFNDLESISLEVESVWAVFQNIAHRHGVKAAVVEACEKPKSFGISKSAGWVWKKGKDGKWHVPGENDQGLVPKQR